jgi:hypothetical protein
MVMYGLSKLINYNGIYGFDQIPEPLDAGVISGNSGWQYYEALGRAKG